MSFVGPIRGHYQEYQGALTDAFIVNVSDLLKSLNWYYYSLHIILFPILASSESAGRCFEIDAIRNNKTLFPSTLTLRGPFGSFAAYAHSPNRFPYS